MPNSEAISICPSCGGPMTMVFKGKRKQFVCEKCDADPMNSPKVNKLLEAIRPPK